MHLPTMGLFSFSSSSGSSTSAGPSRLPSPAQAAPPAARAKRRRQQQLCADCAPCECAKMDVRASSGKGKARAVAAPMLARVASPSRSSSCSSASSISEDEAEWQAAGSSARSGSKRRAGAALGKAAAVLALGAAAAAAVTSLPQVSAISSSLDHVDCQRVNWTIIVDQYDAPFDVIELYVGRPPYLDGQLRVVPPSANDTAANTTSSAASAAATSGKSSKSKKGKRGHKNSKKSSSSSAADDGDSKSGSADNDGDGDADDAAALGLTAADLDFYGFAENFTAADLGLPPSAGEAFFIRAFDLAYGRTLKLTNMQPVGFRLYSTAATSSWGAPTDEVRVTANASSVPSPFGAPLNGTSCEVLATNGFLRTQARGNEVQHDFSMCKHAALPFGVSNNPMDDDSGSGAGAASSVGMGGATSTIANSAATGTTRKSSGGGSSRLSGPYGNDGSDEEVRGPGLDGSLVFSDQLAIGFGTAGGTLVAVLLAFYGIRRYRRSAAYRRRKRAAIMWESASFVGADGDHSDGANSTGRPSTESMRYRDDADSMTAVTVIGGAGTDAAASSTAADAESSFAHGASTAWASGSPANAPASANANRRSTLGLQLDTSPAALAPAVTRGRVERPLTAAAFTPLTADDLRDLGLTPTRSASAAASASAASAAAASGAAGTGAASAARQRFPDDEHELDLRALALAGPPPEYAASVRSTEVVLPSPAPWDAAPPSAPAPAPAPALPPHIFHQVAHAAAVANANAQAAATAHTASSEASPTSAHASPSTPGGSGSGSGAGERTFQTAAYNSPFTFQGVNPFATPLNATPPVPLPRVPSYQRTAPTTSAGSALLSPFSDAHSVARTGTELSSGDADADADTEARYRRAPSAAYEQDREHGAASPAFARERTPSVAGTTRIMLDEMVREDSESEFWAAGSDGASH